MVHRYNHAVYLTNLKPPPEPGWQSIMPCGINDCGAALFLRHVLCAECNPTSAAQASKLAPCSEPHQCCCSNHTPPHCPQDAHYRRHLLQDVLCPLPHRHPSRWSSAQRHASAGMLQAAARSKAGSRLYGHIEGGAPAHAASCAHMHAAHCQPPRRTGPPPPPSAAAPPQLGACAHGGQ